MKKKVYYEVPSAELIIVRFEENFCQTGGYGTKGSAGGTMTVNDLGEGDDDLY